MVLVEGNGAAKETNDGCCFLVAEDLCIGEPAVVVDRDVNVLPALLAPGGADRGGCQ